MMIFWCIACALVGYIVGCIVAYSDKDGGDEKTIRDLMAIIQKHKTTTEQAIQRIEEHLKNADKAISEDEEYIRGWKSAMLVALEIDNNIFVDDTLS